MKLHFTCGYHSTYGENVFIRFHTTQMPFITEFPMLFFDEKLWGLELERDELPSESKLVYDIIVKNDNERVLASKRMIDVMKISGEHIFIHDEPQRATYPHLPSLYQIPFAGKSSGKKDDDKHPDFIIFLQLPVMHPDLIPCISGKGKKFGKWTGKPMLFHQKNNGWMLKIRITDLKLPVEFKIAIFDKRKKEIIEWERGENRIINTLPQTNEILWLNAAPELALLQWKAAGINVPLTALVTENTWGCGDFTSLKMLGDWCVKCQIKMIQLLPLFDTTATHTKADSYPYAPISAFALHPVLMDVQQLLRLYDIPLDEEVRQRIIELNAAEKFHIQDVMELKFKLLRLIYDEVNTTFKDDFSWFTFFDLNREWMQPYAVFCYQRDLFKTADFTTWSTLNVYDESAVEELASRENDAYYDISFYYFIQYHLHLQFMDAIEYLHTKSIILKGDLPIGVGRNSVDTWMFPQLFHLDQNAGAPPDAFTQSGQNWGFPTYNWPAMKAEDYCWFRRRLQHLETYYDALRIDHIIGLFRVWSIPVYQKDGRMGIFEPAIGFTENELREHHIHTSIERLTQPFNEFDQDVILLKKEGLFHFRINMQHTDSFRSLSDTEQFAIYRFYEHYFHQRHNELWKFKGEEIIKEFQQFTKMLLCAEDLGMVPPMVESVLHDNNVLCLRVERMPVNNEQMFSTANAPYLSVITPSTHDMSPIREWWLEKEAPVQWYFNYELLNDGLAPDDLNIDNAKSIIRNHLQSPAIFAVFLVQDILSMDETLRNPEMQNERINDPAQPDFEWSYRMPVSLETLAHSKSFNKEFKKMIRSSGR